jgi:large subunit ribosomal protein L23
MKDAYQIIRNIRLTEKAAIATEMNNEYVFEVHPKANKLEIAQAIRTIFGKKVDSVRTSNYAGKARRKSTAAAGFTASWKKAVVRLAPGETIDLT